MFGNEEKYQDLQEQIERNRRRMHYAGIPNAELPGKDLIRLPKVKGKADAGYDQAKANGEKIEKLEAKLEVLVDLLTTAKKKPNPSSLAGRVRRVEDIRSRRDLLEQLLEWYEKRYSVPTPLQHKEAREEVVDDFLKNLTPQT